MYSDLVKHVKYGVHMGVHGSSDLGFLSASMGSDHPNVESTVVQVRGSVFCKYAEILQGRW